MGESIYHFKNSIIMFRELSKAEAISQLSQVTDVTGWNVARDSLKRRLSIEAISEIDSSGLIVKVLGQDGQKSTKPPALTEEYDALD